MINPENMTHRSGKMAVDLSYIIARWIDTVSEFIPRKELFQLQMNTLYVLIDIMGATSNADPQQVLDQCKEYFKKLNREKFANEEV
jgi:hypothetical protein